jgi:hypothetical protein
MVHVSNRAHVNVRLRTLKLAFCHFSTPKKATISTTANTTIEHNIQPPGCNAVLVPFAGIGPATSPLPRECSTTEPKGQTLQNNQTSGAGEGNRTLVLSLEGFSSTIELHPPNPKNPHQNLKLTGGEGWIRTSVLVRGQIYSLLPLTTRPPLQRTCDYSV